MDPLCSSYGACTYMGHLAQVIIFVDAKHLCAQSSLNVSKVKVEYILCYLLLAW